MRKLLLLAFMSLWVQLAWGAPPMKPHLSIAVPCFPWNGEQVLCVPLDDVRNTKVFFVRHDGKLVCEGRRVGLSKQESAFDTFKAAVFRAEGCQITDQSEYFAVFGPDIKARQIRSEVASESVQVKADQAVSCIGCEEFARVKGVKPNVTAFEAGSPAPQFLHYLIPTYAQDGRNVGPTVFVYNNIVKRLPGWCNTAPVLFE